MMNWLPSLIFAVLSIVGGIVTFMLPETVGRNLPTTVEEVASWPLTLTEEEKIAFKNEKIFNKKHSRLHIVDDGKTNENEIGKKPTNITNISQTIPNNQFAYDNPNMMFTSNV